MSPPQRLGAWRAWATTFVLVLSLVLPASAQTTRIPVSVVEGRLVVRCDVSTRFRRLPVNLFLDYEETCGLQLHNQAAAGLKSETADGRSFPITVHLPGLDLMVERREIGDDVYLNEFTKWNSIALGEVSVVGTIGAKLLKDYHIVFDLDAGFIELEPPREQESEPVDPPDGVLRIPITQINDICWVPVDYDGGTPGAMVLGTGVYDTTVDGFLAEDLGSPAGDIGSINLSDIDLARYVAFRPAEINYMHPDGAIGVTGINWLEHFRVEVDRVNSCIYVQEMRPAAYPEGDLEFFAAMVDEDTDGIRTFLDKYPEHRMALEASRLLVTLLLIAGADVETARGAMAYVNDASPEDLRATSALNLMRTCNAFGLPEHLIASGEIGLEGGRDDRYPDAVHKIHARLGETHLELDHEDKSWRHLLSAAFGMPEDGMINLNLARFYEKQERYKRAFSRFLQAAIRAESGPQAVEGLSRVAPLIDGGEGYSVDVVEKMIAGKVRNFGAASEFEATEENTSNRVVLVEFFTNSFLGDGSRGAIAGGLASEGLLSHFPPENVAFLSYHLPAEKLDPLINELGVRRSEELGVPGPWMFSVDGRSQHPGAGRWSDAESIYNRVRDDALDRLTRKSKFEMELTGRVEEGFVRGELVVGGKARRNTKVQVVLAEKGVLFPGSTEVVVHRMLARAGLTDSIDWEPEDESMTIPFEMALDAIRLENEAYIDDLCSTTGGMVRKLSMAIDPAQIRFVAHVRDSFNGHTLQAISVEPENLEDLQGDDQ